MTVDVDLYMLLFIDSVFADALRAPIRQRVRGQERVWPLVQRSGPERLHVLVELTGSLKRTLASTNPCESMIECVRRTSRNVKRWQSGEMALCWTAAGMLEAERQFRRVIGYRELAKLALAAERELHRHPIQEVAVTLA